MTHDSAAALLGKIQRTSFAERAYDAIRESIVAGRFKAGDQLVETRLAEELGVSRGPVREALKRLREEGLVVDNLHKGAHVRTFNVGDIVDLYNVRIGLESVAIRLATRRRQSTKQLRELIDEMAAAAKDGDIGRLSNRELAFHETLCELSGNQYVYSLFRSIAAQVRVALELDSAEYDDPLKVAVEHRPLVTAIESGNEELAVRRLEEHVVQGVSAVLYHLAGAEEAEVALNRLLEPPADDLASASTNPEGG